MPTRARSMWKFAIAFIFRHLTYKASVALVANPAWLRGDVEPGLRPWRRRRWPARKAVGSGARIRQDAHSPPCPAGHAQHGQAGYMKVGEAILKPRLRAIFASSRAGCSVGDFWAVLNKGNSPLQGCKNTGKGAYATATQEHWQECQCHCHARTQAGVPVPLPRKNTGKSACATNGAFPKIIDLTCQV